MAMRQALHIFRKDLRHLRWEILVVLGAVAGLTYTTIRAAEMDVSWRGYSVMAYLLPVAWWVLVARLVFAEPLPGDTQFWVTRPYSWKSLLAAKVLFVLAFVNLPKLVSDAVVLWANGFDLPAEVPGFLWSQLLLLAVFVLPAAALCAVTTGFVQLVGVALGLVLAVAAWNELTYEITPSDPWFRMEWVREFSIEVPVLVAAMAIILWQYARRATAGSRILAGAVVAIALSIYAWLPWRTAFAIQSGLSGGSAGASDVRVGFDPNEDRPVVARIDSPIGVELSSPIRVEYEYDSDEDRPVVARVDFPVGVELSIPIRVSGLPDSLAPVVARIVAEMEGPPGEPWPADRLPAFQLRSSSAGGPSWIRTWVDESFYQEIRHDSLRIRGTAYLTLYGNAHSTVLRVGDQPEFRAVEGVGICAAIRSEIGSSPVIILDCRSSFRSPRGDVSFGVRDVNGVTRTPRFRDLSAGFGLRSYSPFPAALGLIPVTRTVRYAAADSSIVEVVLGIEEPVAYISRDFEITGLRFADYEEQK